MKFPSKTGLDKRELNANGHHQNTLPVSSETVHTEHRSQVCEMPRIMGMLGSWAVPLGWAVETTKLDTGHRPQCGVHIKGGGRQNVAGAGWFKLWFQNCSPTMQTGCMYLVGRATQGTLM